MNEGMHIPGSWGVQPMGIDSHVVPNGDLKPHYLTEHCWCKPNVEYTEALNELECGIKGYTVPAIVVHFALDDRESYEQGRELH